MEREVRIVKTVNDVYKVQIRFLPVADHAKHHGWKTVYSAFCEGRAKRYLETMDLPWEE